MKEIPVEKDWGNYKSDLDVKHAFLIFAGKSNTEMQSEFKKNVMERSFDIAQMPKVPFQYYIFGYKQHIDSEDFGQFSKPDAVSCFIGLIETKLKTDPDFVLPILEELIPTIEHIANNQKYFEADVDIYGDFKNKFDFIIEALKRSQSK